MSRSMFYRMRLTDSLLAVHEDEDEDTAVELLKDLTADQRTEILVTLEMYRDAVERARRESGDL